MYVNWGGKSEFWSVVLLEEQLIFFTHTPHTHEHGLLNFVSVVFNVISIVQKDILFTKVIAREA